MTPTITISDSAKDMLDKYKAMFESKTYSDTIQILGNKYEILRYKLKELKTKKD